MIRIKRTYERPSREDGYRVLVDRLWPRGLSKVKAGVDLWLKEIAPSERLRKEFSHDPQKWESFSVKYERELKNNGELISAMRHLEKEKGTITLLYSAKNENCNNAAVLKNVLTNNDHAQRKE